MTAALPAFDLGRLIRDVPDFPRPGITFKDITPLLRSPQALELAIDGLAGPWRGIGITQVIGIESRGFIFAPAVAQRLGAGFVPARKPGKLPARSIRQSYGLEYGQDVLELHEDALTDQDLVLVLDDVLATGGTASAAIALARRLGAKVAGVAVLVELRALAGAQRLDVPVHSVLSF